jgi:hypothetical protein
MASFLRNPGHTVLSATRARQGRYGRHVLWVLLVSTALAALALFAAWTWKAPDLAATEANKAKPPADARAFDMDAPAPATQQTSPSVP